MKTIATLTMNPTIDVAYEVQRVFPTHKMRTEHEYHNPGGGGINVARVFVRLGGTAQAWYMSGGATGVALDGLLDHHRLDRQRLAIAGETRVSTSVLERESGREYRFVPPGPTLAEAEWTDALARLARVECHYLVISGSLPPGVPEDFYARLAALAAPRGIKVVVDSSGPALRAAVAGGGLFLIKPSQGELQQLVGQPLEDRDAIARAAARIVADGGAEHVAVTMGHDGAVLANADGTLYLPVVPIEARSAVGAGDSFLAGMIHGICAGRPIAEAFRYGMAAGSAAVLTPGTDLARPDDIERLFTMMSAAGYAEGK